MHMLIARLLRQLYSLLSVRLDTAISGAWTILRQKKTRWHLWLSTATGWEICGNWADICREAFGEWLDLLWQGLFCLWDGKLQTQQSMFLCFCWPMWVLEHPGCILGTASFLIYAKACCELLQAQRPYSWHTHLSMTTLSSSHENHCTCFALLYDHWGCCFVLRQHMPCAEPRKRHHGWREDCLRWDSGSRKVLIWYWETVWQQPA